jgi:type I restriction enzyme S subunit
MKNPTPANPTMIDTILFEHFATLATAPDGIARLRELILHLAVQGQLGTQDTGDEPASKLSSKILEEKKRLIKKGEISKSRALPEIESGEIPFQIPKNWIWLRLDDIGNSCGQKEPDKVFTYIDVTAINKERGRIGDDVNVLQPNEAPSRARKLVKKGSVIYSTVRPYLLNIAIVDKDFNPEPIVSTAFAVLHPFEGIFNRYLFYYLRSTPFVEYVESQMTGMAYPAINDQKFHMGLIPVPPTAEQHRIVTKVDRLMALCDELETRQQQERADCLNLAPRVLRDCRMQRCQRSLSGSGCKYTRNSS